MEASLNINSERELTGFEGNVFARSSLANLKMQISWISIVQTKIKMHIFK